MRPNEERASPTTDLRGRTSRTELSVPGELIVASNRQPYRHEYVSAPPAGRRPSDEAVSDSDGTATDGGFVDVGRNRDTQPARSEITVECPTGGLTAGLDPVLSRSGGTWIAWGDGEADRAVADEDGCVRVPPGDESYTLRRVWLSDAAVDGYYYGYSNRVLWPTCHELLEYVDHRPDDWTWYRRVNREFADAVVDHASEDAVVWLQDYHLGLAPRLIRESVPESVTIAQFWHIPWPRPSVFGSSPLETTLLEGLLGNDFLGFHIEEYCDAFLATVDSHLPDASVEYASGTVRYDGTETRVGATPMGVDAETYDRQSRALDGSRWESIRSRYGIPDDVTVGLGVDRLDYSKGIPARLDAIERLFERYPSRREAFTFVQKATPSRTDIPAYAVHGERVREAVGRINDRFGTETWQPIVYTEDVISREDLCALYRYADLLVVSSLLDGMNLVAQEYVASSVDGEGTLVLSDRAGVASSFDDAAYTVDPTNVDALADAIDEALSASPLERHRRMTRLREHTFARDLEWWMTRQFEVISRLHDHEHPDSETAVTDGRNHLSDDANEPATDADSSNSPSC
ncbi:alpha,alpha-trehalose-phosphate synthase (UDP-forming) [Natronobiforma cellulositropha]|uniref:alpha,alpha-trehalose-phosphate synthase (UDP-forming) n=1 Tax=Natronobiforma cellulositropha TaxID=1679076 RepID=UPI0021D5B220|nr:trehalose-6-phosphate synthase [Natronobiforma cellulositropha]